MQYPLKRLQQPRERANEQSGKGSGDISFNTFNTSSEVAATDVPYPNPDEFHDVKAELRDENGSDVSITFYLDGEKVVSQVGVDYVGAGFWLYAPFWVS